ncbi:hypothetical protein, partial [Gordonia sp. (in: high G+C Gram-positive bacteria)]|uniref:hypothetical protein n=1 Tax=Gordonia sp. (in: high G+C Gram-positive bacteria) TaxID=84139 RepID=UPI0039E245BD
MSTHSDDQRAADALDVAIADALAGDRTDPVLGRVVDAFAVEPPPDATARIARRLAAASPRPATPRRHRPP